ncbi:MAG: diguanylate cyclase [Anaerolineales bacterium]|nr:diguanylate cyclase [Anaerolineales bacterium]
MIYKLVLILLILSGMILLVLSIIASQRRSSPLWLPFTLTTLCAAIWNFGFAAEIISPTLDGKLFWANVQFIGIVFLPLAWLAMTMITTGQSPKTLRAVPFLGIVPALSLIIIWTNPYHIFRQNPSINSIDVPFPVLVNNYGFYFFAVHAPYNYLLFIASFYLLFRSRRQGLVISRRQRSVLIASLALPLLVDTLYILDITPIPAFNFTSIFFTISGLLMGINVLRLHFLDLLPLAYEASIIEMDVGTIVLDASGKVTHLNPAAEKVMGTACEQVIGKDAQEVFPLLAPLWTSEIKKCEIVVQQEENDFTYQVTRSPISQARNRLVGKVITMVDISERARLHRQVEELSLTDPLTGVLNRRALARYGEQEVERAHRYQHDLSLILVDIDNFKSINDQFGHPVGDAILKATAQVMRKVIRSTDYIFRYGGDEFVILLLETQADAAFVIAQRIQKELSRLESNGELPAFLSVKISAGITTLTEDDDLEKMLQRADHGVYQAKSAGRSQIVIL